MGRVTSSLTADAQASSAIPAELAARWVAQTLPKARALLAPHVRQRVATMSVRARPVPDPRAAPLGAFMITWPEHRDAGTGPLGIVNYLERCDFFLNLLRLPLEESGVPRVEIQRALSDRSRLRIAVTNDVLQVLAPSLSETYSMIRHHALMFLAATIWLPTRQRERWFTIYRQAARHLSTSQPARSPASADQLLANWERDAFAAFAALANDSCAPAPAARLLLDDSGQRRAIIDYLHAAHASVGLLADSYAATPPAERTAWLTDQVARRYLNDEYLLKEWHTLLRHAAPRQPHRKGKELSR